MTHLKSSTQKPTEKPPLSNDWLSVDTMHTLFVQRIKDKRRALQETRKAFGKRFGVKEGTVANWENGKSIRIPHRVRTFVLPEVS